MRGLLALALFALTGCGASPPTQPVFATVAADAASVAVFGRGMGDLVVSAVTGKDCSIVHLEQGKTYCKPTEPPPAVPPFCTRSLGLVDCWSNPMGLNGQPPRSVADGPSTLSPEQEKDRTARWPKL
jgi:hypothetical protein